MADGSGSQELVPQETSPRANGLQSVRTVQDAIPVLDTARFEHMQRIASVIASSSLVPEHLRGKVADCFLIVNQAVRWAMDPFAVAQCMSVVHGKLCYEGKLVAAVLDAKLGVHLDYAWEGEGENMRVQVSGEFADGRTRTIEGSVVEWKTTGKGSPWTPSQYRKMLAYRGAREWARLWAPGTMLGVYAPDEMDDLIANRARDITPSTVQVAAQPSLPRPKGPPPAPPKGPPPAPAAKEPEPAAEPFQDPAAYIEHLSGEIAACSDLATLEEVWAAHLEASDARLSREDQDKCTTLYEVRKAKVPAVPA